MATVKCLDIKDNSVNIVKLDPIFAPKYLREKAEALQSLLHADPIVWRLTWEQIANAVLDAGSTTVSKDADHG